MSKVYGVIFNEGTKTYLFNFDDEIEINKYVIVDTEKGQQLGKIVEIDIEDTKGEELKNIIRIATDEDYENYLKNTKDAYNALKKCSEIVKDMDLNMRVASAQYNFDRSQLLFNFTADERIDFRELAKKLASIYHTRIELRQIGARDKAREVGGIGICGKTLCCQNFLNQIDSVSMNMAKNQNLALNPSKINGCCGRLLCCLTYEDAEYLECSKGLPSIGDEINTEKGKGTVLSIDILNRKGKVLINGNKEEISFK